MRSPFFLAFVVTLLAASVSTLGINCRGSFFCPLAAWDNESPLPITQILRDALYQSKAPDSTPYNSGDHVICVSNTLTINLTLPIIDPTGLTSGMNLGSWHLGGNIKDGGICLFPQYLKSGPLTLGMIRKLVDKVLEHGCETCGSVPIHFVDQGSNDPGDGILTFNYVRHPYCTENCLTDGLVANGNKTAAAAKPRMAQRMLASVPLGTAAAIGSDPPNASVTRKVPAVIGIPASAMATAAAAAQSDSPRAALSARSNVPTVAADDEKTLKRKARIEKQRAANRNVLTAPFQANTAKKDTEKRENHATRENAERKRAASEMVKEKRGLNSRSAKFADLAPRRNEGAQGKKGWIGWLRV